MHAVQVGCTPRQAGQQCECAACLGAESHGSCRWVEHHCPWQGCRGVCSGCALLLFVTRRCSVVSLHNPPALRSTTSSVPVCGLESPPCHVAEGCQTSLVIKRSAVHRSLRDDTNAVDLIPFADLIRTTTWDMLVAEQNLDDNNVALGAKFRATCISTAQVGMV